MFAPRQGPSFRTAAAPLATLLCVAGALAARAAFEPGPTLPDDLKRPQPELRAGYLAARPRLQVGPGDKAALQARAAAHPKQWLAVTKWADELKKDSVTPELIRRGSGYHFRPNRVLAAALAAWLKDDPDYRKLATEWLLRYCAEDTWGTGWRENVDLTAAWYGYYFGLSYDLLSEGMSDADRSAIRTGLAAHARAIYEDQRPKPATTNNVDTGVRWEQNHTYIPLVGMTAIALALEGEVPEAAEWRTLAFAALRRVLWVQGEDGYHFEGTGYWDYAMHWLMRGGFLMERATGEAALDIPHLRNAALYARHMQLPGPPTVFDLGDSGGVNNWPGGEVGQRPDLPPAYTRYFLRGAARAYSNTVAQAMAHDMAARYNYNLDPAIEFLWDEPAVQASTADTMPPYHYFPDHDVVAWRSGWDKDASCYVFRCGPPEGHAATAKLARLTDWTMNSGHAHPDVGAFTMFARGSYLAVDTGYLCEKTAAAHNTLLVDGKGQWNDGSYWAYRGTPYAQFDRLHIEKVHLGDDYGYACGNLSAAYPDTLGELSIRRHLVMARDWLLVVDEMQSPAPHGYTWLVHADGPVEAATNGTFLARAGNWTRKGAGVVWTPGSTLLVKPLAPAGLRALAGRCVVSGGGKPGQGVKQQRGFQLALDTPDAQPRQRFVVLLSAEPTLGDAKLMEADDAHVRIQTGGAPGELMLRLDWKPPEDGKRDAGPLRLGTAP